MAMTHLVPLGVPAPSTIGFRDLCSDASETGEPLAISWTDGQGYQRRDIGRAAGLFQSPHGEEFVFLQDSDGYRGIALHKVTRIERLASNASGVTAISRRRAWA